MVNVAIIGGAGKMGQWLARLLQKAGHRVILADQNRELLLALKLELKVDIASNSEACESRWGRYISGQYR